ncbi:unnamed protein product [Diatraea saccharalis]|uniref:Uncharacterized protein n=1 Tax=Diatraea saccharalis TaxID=40085 RepID=A0A9N9RGH3_9NEOP|nr:unnamed protein product [Diatraea saccharalis]
MNRLCTEQIPAPAQFPGRGSAEGAAWGAGPLLAGAGAALLAALLLLAALAYRRRGDINRVSFLPHAVALTSTDNKAYIPEMYEISPYATFSMSGGGGGGGPGVGGGTLRTFGRAEPELAAAPPHKHRSPTNTDEYTLSRAMTLMVRRSESDSDSSESPCAECNSSVSYRVPVAPSKEEMFRSVTDSSAESGSASAAASAAAGSAGSAVSAPSARARGGCGAHDKPRRRPRRHHAPPASRYLMPRRYNTISTFHWLVYT